MLSFFSSPTKKMYFKTDLLVIIMLLIQIAFWFVSREHKANLAIVPDVPSTLSVKAYALGDEEFYFRVLAYQLQNAGDSFGRFTALKDYNYNQLYHWFTLLDTLNSKSHFVPSMASYYYSQTQNRPDVRYVVNYLDEHSSKDLNHNWWWLGQAVYLANFKLGDKPLALKLAKKLATTPRQDIPLWTRQMPAFIYEQMGEGDQAMMIIADIINNIDNISEGEQNFMRYFVQDRLNKIIEMHPELKKLQK